MPKETKDCMLVPNWSCQECQAMYNALRKQEVRNCPPVEGRKYKYSTINRRVNK